MKNALKSTASRVTAAGISLTAGLVNGIIGTGGGVVLTYMFSRLDGHGGIKESLSRAMAVMLPVSCVSLLTYQNGYFDSVPQLLVTVLPALVGGFAGGALSRHATPLVLRRLFGAVMLWGGLSIIF